jgi:A/G-specific adenine glycosylase
MPVRAVVRCWRGYFDRIMIILDSSTIRSFRKKVLAHYRTDGRDLPWRTTTDPYRILVSEIMLQQTQVERVIDKYRAFLAVFPDFSTLATAPLPELLRLWQGMGYNRRALSLRALAQQVVTGHNGSLPANRDTLITLPGIGPYTSGAIMAFAFNMPVVFMDTNIRRVFIHEFFQDSENIHDNELLPLVEQTLDVRNLRNWYNALMDYGATLKRTQANPNKRSAHYARQSPFENSNRQVRGRILKAILNEAPLTVIGIAEATGMERGRVVRNLGDLEKEGFIIKKGRRYSVPETDRS